MRRAASRRAAVAAAAFFPVLALLAPILAREEPWLRDANGRTVLHAPIPYDPQVADLVERLQPPGRAHLLGTDELGRDVLSRLVHGARVSVAAGLIASALALGFGAVFGACGGVAGGKTDRAILFGVDVVQAFPALVLVAAGAAFLNPSFLTAALLIGFTSWPESARIVRAEARRLRGAPFVEAARAAGASRVRILFSHILPHALPPALATAPYVLGAAVLTEAAVSFLGLGTPPPTPSWGRALADARAYLTEAWWCVLAPSTALLLLVLSARKLGDALSESDT